MFNQHNSTGGRSLICERATSVLNISQYLSFFKSILPLLKSEALKYEKCRDFFTTIALEIENVNNSTTVQTHLNVANAKEDKAIYICLTQRL
jgi:uncharacterized membrane protein required for colicin V production